MMKTNKNSDDLKLEGDLETVIRAILRKAIEFSKATNAINKGSSKNLLEEVKSLPTF